MVVPTLDGLKNKSIHRQVAEQLQKQANTSKSIIDEQLLRTSLHQALASAGMATKRPCGAVKLG